MAGRDGAEINIKMSARRATAIATTAHSMKISFFEPSDLIFESLIELVRKLTAMVSHGADLRSLWLLTSVEALLLGTEQFLFQET